jgi:hypothetical protein
LKRKTHSAGGPERKQSEDLQRKARAAGNALYINYIEAKGRMHKAES